MFISDKDSLFISKLDDAVDLCYTRQKPYFFPFLSERRQAIAKSYLESVCFQNYCFFGGYDNSERKMLCLFYDVEPDEFPISALEFCYRLCDKLSHRDFLGTLMSLGIERETIGDILVGDGKTVVFVKCELKSYITSQLVKIGNTGIKIKDADLSDIPQGRGTEELTVIVSSLRLDSLVAAITGLSREKTKSFILGGNVSLNFIQVENISKPSNVGDTLIVRGKGKYILNAVMGETKKGRLRISLIHFR